MPLKASDRIALIPYSNLDGTWTLDDAVVLEAGRRAERQGILGVVFPDRKVSTAEEFLQMMQSPANLPVFAFHAGRCAGVAWLNGIGSRHAFGHFLFLKESRGEIAREAGGLFLRYWKSFRDGDEPVLDVILGLVPTDNEPAIRFVQELGMVRLGDIPKIAYRASGTLLYFTG